MIVSAVVSLVSTIRPHSSLGYRPPAPEAIRLVQTYGSWNYDDYFLSTIFKGK